MKFRLRIIILCLLLMIITYYNRESFFESTKVKLKVSVGNYRIHDLSSGLTEIINNSSHDSTTYKDSDSKLISTKTYRSTIKHLKDTPCLCLDQATGKMYDLCYTFTHPETNETLQGKRFSCKWVQHLKHLHLLGAEEYWRVEDKGLPTQPVFVSAASANHFLELMRLTGLVQKYFPDHKMIIYDLGLLPYHVSQLEGKGAEVRDFVFEKYPKYFSHLTEFRWKPVVIAEVLRVYPFVWYMDSSVVWLNNAIDPIYQLLQCRQALNKSYQRPLMNSSPLWLNAGFSDRQLLDTFTKRCDKFAYMLQGFTGHGIFSATHPAIYMFLPTDVLLLKRESSKMYEAGFALIVRTKEVIERVLKWYVLCALEGQCMAPEGARLACSFQKDPYARYAGCHRFDQSVVNLLLANENAFDSYFFTTSGLVRHFKIVRGGWYSND